MNRMSPARHVALAQDGPAIARRPLDGHGPACPVADVEAVIDERMDAGQAAGPREDLLGADLGMAAGPDDVDEAVLGDPVGHLGRRAHDGVAFLARRSGPGSR